MTDSFRALTAKEKQTLQLLLAGHDAKSIARHLGLSVHTIHERLREARRKLGTASSREAARLLGEFEQGDTGLPAPPQSLGDKAIGDAAVRDPVQPVRQPAEGPGSDRRVGWIAGGVVMIISLAGLALSALSGQDIAPVAPAAPAAPVAPTAPVAPAAPVAAPAPVIRTAAAEAAAVESARRVLALIDRDDWRASWQAAHRSFQLQNTVEWWAQASRQVRGRVGTAQSREWLRADFTPAPPAGYWAVSFRTRYSITGEATETLQMAYQDGTWKMAGITID